MSSDQFAFGASRYFCFFPLLSADGIRTALAITEKPLFFAVFIYNLEIWKGGSPDVYKRQLYGKSFSNSKTKIAPISPPPQPLDKELLHTRSGYNPIILYPLPNFKKGAETMASYRPRKNKFGQIISYEIRVSRGYDPVTRRALKPYTTTWKVPDGGRKNRIER